MLLSTAKAVLSALAYSTKMQGHRNDECTGKMLGVDDKEECAEVEKCGRSYDTEINGCTFPFPVKCAEQSIPKIGSATVKQMDVFFIAH